MTGERLASHDVMDRDQVWPVIRLPGVPARRQVRVRCWAPALRPAVQNGTFGVRAGAL
jgi:hypothetical protein